MHWRGHDPYPGGRLVPDIWGFEESIIDESPKETKPKPVNMRYLGPSGQGTLVPEDSSRKCQIPSETLVSEDCPCKCQPKVWFQPWLQSGVIWKSPQCCKPNQGSPWFSS